MVYVFLADGFELVEAMTPVDIMRRAGIEVTTVSLNKTTSVLSSQNVVVEADTTTKSLAPEKLLETLEAVVLPGGMPGAQNLNDDDTVSAFIAAATLLNKHIAAICAAPMIPGKRGLLKGRRAVCYPGFEQHLEGAVLTGGRVEVDGTYVTGCGMGAALEFSIALTRLLKGDEAADQLFASVLAK